MFDVGFTEILMIGVVALVVIGPERLPAVAKTAGQWIGKLQRFVRGVKTDLASELQSGDLKKLIGDQREQINELRNMVSSAKKDFENSSREVVQGAKKSLGELESSVKELESVSAERERAAAASANTSTSDAATDVREPVSSVNVKTAELSAETGSAGNSSTAVESSSGTSFSSDVVNPLPSKNDSGNKTPTMRTDSSSSLDDSADRNRTGTESGS